MSRSRLWLLALMAALLATPTLAEAPVERRGPVVIARIDGSINPASSTYLQRAIEEAAQRGAAILLIELDTPGGLVSSTQDIIQAMLASTVPIVVYVAPQGAWAGSAGTFITLAAHVAAMAPGSSIGAAHPVDLGGGGAPAPQTEGDEKPSASHAEQKAENMLAAFIESIAKKRERNVEWAAKAVEEAEAITQAQALELRVIDLVADDVPDLLEQLEGREVEVAGGEVRVLALADSELRRLEMSPLQALFNWLADPNVAFLLVMAGLAGLYIEFNQPGLILPGAAGAVCLLLAGIAFQILPFSWVGLMVLLLGVGLIAAELFITSYGLLFAAGVVCLLLGGVKIFDVPEVSGLSIAFWGVLVPVVASFAACAGAVIWLVSRAMLAPQTAGVEEMIGARGRAISALEPAGKIFVHGEYWSAESEEPVAAGESVEVVAVEGLRLRVRPGKGKV
jgi:membrane-bound serine protease (ClpP class)